MKKIVSIIPLLLIAVILYNVITILDRNLAHVAILDHLIVICMLPSMDLFCLTVNDLIIIISLIILYFEVFKSTKSSDTIVFEHIFSIFTFLLCLFEFIFIHMFSTPTFFILTLMALFDACAGITITISVARRDFKVRM